MPYANLKTLFKKTDWELRNQNERALLTQLTRKSMSALPFCCCFLALLKTKRNKQFSKQVWQFLLLLLFILFNHPEP